jgi:hypothetical protein
MPIMQRLYELGAHGPTLATLNHCRLYLQAFFISDITDFYGHSITTCSWQGTRAKTSTNHFTWPTTTKPSPTAWDIWRTYLAQGITTGRRSLVQRLGAWRIDDPLWPWYFNPADELLYEKCGDDWWVYTKMPSRTRRLLYHMKS